MREDLPHLVFEAVVEDLVRFVQDERSERGEAEVLRCEEVVDKAAGVATRMLIPDLNCVSCVFFWVPPEKRLYVIGFSCVVIFSLVAAGTFIISQSTMICLNSLPVDNERVI
jgi:hypothetical protein